MHYKDGTPARVGDVCKMTYQERSYAEKAGDATTVVNTNTKVGQLVRASTSPSGACNGVIVPTLSINEGVHGRSVFSPLPSEWCVTIGDCEKVA